jgi:hypothetical protein
MLTDALAPKNLVVSITNDDAHVRPISVTVYHGI